MYEDKSELMPLVEALAVLLSDTVILANVSKGYHWNVVGSDFKEMHEFFEEIYSDANGAIDPMAENIVKLGFDAPYLLEDFIRLSCAKDLDRIGGEESEIMIASLLDLNEHLISCAKGAFSIANEMNEQGIANFLAERIDMHRKWKWQLKATLGYR